MSTTMMHKAQAGARTLKAEGAAGEVRVAFAQLNVVDHDNDYTMPGAFEAGQKVKVCQTGHAHGSRVAGCGVIVGEETMPDGSLWAVADLKFFLDTEAGREEYATVKALHDAGHSQEWSYGYDTLAASPMEVDGQYVNGLQKQSAYEISPVLRGAGIGTHTLAVKAKGKGECEACGQPLPKADANVCPECGKPLAQCDCSAKAADDDAAKWSTEQALIQFELTRARMLGVDIDMGA